MKELTFEEKMKFYSKIKEKLKKYKKVLVIVVDKDLSEKYNSVFLKKSIEHLKKLFNLSKKQIMIENISGLLFEHISSIKETPAYYLFEVDNIEEETAYPYILWYGEGYYLPKR